MSDLGNLFGELAAARARYEDLRVSGAPLGERAHARTALHELRARAGEAHRNGRV